MKLLVQYKQLLLSAIVVFWVLFFIFGGNMRERSVLSRISH